MQGVEGVEEKGGLVAGRAEEIQNEPLQGSNEALSCDDLGSTFRGKTGCVRGALAEAQKGEDGDSFLEAFDAGNKVIEKHGTQL